MAIPNQYGDNDQQGKSEARDSTDDLVTWCMTRVQRARQVRDDKFGGRWDEYTRLWRGFWTDKDRNLNSERSKLISPALSQSIEMAVAEIEEAVFNKTAWFDVDDDLQDQQKDDALANRDQLLEDLELANVPDAISKSFLLGAIYGTGIIKLNVTTIDDKILTPEGPVSNQRPLVVAEAIRPDEFVIDPTATTIDEAQFCAHEMVKPLHTIKEKQAKGIYRKGEIGAWSGRKGDSTGTGSTASIDVIDDGTLITEYYGRVPGKMIPRKEGEKPLAGMVEAIITIANEAFVLRAIVNPFFMGDRPVLAYQHDTVPGEFWGRGISEKGYNPQKALDSELRARVDALALMTAPMLGADMTRLPRDPDMRVRPGKIFLTRGRPSEIIEPIGFDARGLAATFQQASDLERMVQMGTGSMDSAAPLSTNRRNETASGMSMLNASFLKRSKRTMQNIERQFLEPLIRRSLWRYIQFDPDRYQQDYKFKVRSAMGIMAKEVESAQLTQMLGFTPPESPAHNIILKALFENTSSSDKDDLKAAIDALMAPPSPEAQQMQQQIAQLQMRLQIAETTKTEAEAQLALAKVQLTMAQTKHELIEADLEDDNVEIQAANTAVNIQKQRDERGWMAIEHRKIDDAEKQRQHEKEQGDKDRGSKEKIAKSKPKPAAKKKSK